MKIEYKKPAYTQWFVPVDNKKDIGRVHISCLRTAIGVVWGDTKSLNGASKLTIHLEADAEGEWYVDGNERLVHESLPAVIALPDMARNFRRFERLSLYLEY